MFKPADQVLSSKAPGNWTAPQANQAQPRHGSKAVMTKPSFGSPTPAPFNSNEANSNGVTRFNPNFENFSNGRTLESSNRFGEQGNWSNNKFITNPFSRDTNSSQLLRNSSFLQKPNGETSTLNSLKSSILVSANARPTMLPPSGLEGATGLSHSSRAEYAGSRPQSFEDWLANSSISTMQPTNQHPMRMQFPDASAIALERAQNRANIDRLVQQLDQTEAAQIAANTHRFEVMLDQLWAETYQNKIASKPYSVCCEVGK